MLAALKAGATPLRTARQCSSVLPVSRLGPAKNCARAPPDLVCVRALAPLGRGRPRQARHGQRPIHTLCGRLTGHLLCRAAGSGERKCMRPAREARSGRGARSAHRAIR